MSDISIENCLVGLLEQAWNQVSLHNDYIYFHEISSLFAQFQALLSLSSSKNLLNSDEISTISQMSDTNPKLRFYYSELRPFILKLVSATSLAGFLMDRLQLNHFELMKMLGIERKSPLTPLGSKYAFSKRSKSPLPSPYPSYSTPRAGASTSPYLKHERWDTDKNLQSRDSRYSGSRKESKYTSDGKPVDYPSRRYLSGNFLPERKQDSSDDLLARAKNVPNSEYTSLLGRLTSAIEEQDSLVHNLKSNLLMSGVDSNELTIAVLATLVQHLPFIKQYKELSSGQTKSLTWMTLAVDFAALVLATIVILNFLKVLLYFTMFLVTISRGVNDFNSYVMYEDGSSSKNYVHFQWWKEIEWLEYWVYNLSDWLE